MKRSDFLKKGVIGTTGLILAPHFTQGKQLFSQDAKEKLDTELVEEFVTYAHGNFEKVKSMLDKNPELLLTSHDWGGGDFEMALEAASHIGHKEIVHFLIDKGARYNIFTAAMLGDILTVQSVLNKFPNLINARGPHNLDLFHHAQVGGKESTLVLEFLNEFSNYQKEELPKRSDLVAAKNDVEKRAVEFVNFIHSETDLEDSTFMHSFFHEDLIEKKGESFFIGIFDKCRTDIPPANVTMLDSKEKNTCKLRLTRTDKSTNFYFRFIFEKSMVTQFGVSGNSALFD